MLTNTATFSRTAQQLAAHERTVQSLRQAEDIRLTQRASSVLKQ
ncbi:conjugal transfer relaxase TraA domain-containing (plasmid) [Rhizobium sp. CIAT894]|nr:conjugal transfer relaxase TraA domain-containing [Rhizobium sp. CIAT894]